MLKKYLNNGKNNISNMELLRFELKEATATHDLFTIEVETTNFWGKPEIEVVDCYRHKHSTQSKFMDGRGLYNRWLYIDDTITAILSTKSKTYTKKTF